MNSIVNFQEVYLIYLATIDLHQAFEANFVSATIRALNKAFLNTSAQTF